MTTLLAAALGVLAPALTPTIAPSPTMTWQAAGHQAGLDVAPAQDELPLRPSLVPS